MVRGDQLARPKGLQHLDSQTRSDRGTRPRAGREVELAKKSAERLQSILGLHARWRAAGRTSGVIYICSDAGVSTRIAHVAKKYGLPESSRSWLRIQQLDAVRAQAVQACEKLRAERGSAGGRPMLDSDAA